jgi:hypothetical protein
MMNGKLGLVLILFSCFAYADPIPVGVWQSDCNKISKHSYRISATFIEGKILFINRLFEDQNCVSNSITTTYDGAYATGGSFGDGIEINFIPASIKFTLHLQSVVDQLNKSIADGCGITDWKINVPQEVSGRYCRPFTFPSSGQMTYEIFRIDQSQLQFGGIPLRWNFNTPSARPTQLSPVRFERIQ